MTSNNSLDFTEDERLSRLKTLVQNETGACMQLSYTVDKGVHVSATSALASGTVVCTASAIGPMPECDYARLVCDNCYQAPPQNTDWFQEPEALPVVCSGCVSISYCGAECETEGKKEHTAEECCAFEHIRTHYRTAVRQHRRRARQLVRLMLLQHSQLEDCRDSYRQLSMLSNNYAAHSVDQVGVLKSLARMAVDTLSAVGVATEPSDHLWAVRMLMAINCNQFGMQRECDGQVFATAVYLVPSLFNHNCTPNVCYRSEGRQLILSTNQAVEKGAELQHSYLQRSNLRTYEVRSEALENSYFFACACDTCANELTLPTEHEGQGHSTPHSDSSGDEAGCYWNSDLSDSD